MTSPCCGGKWKKGICRPARFMLWAKKKHRISLLPGEGEVLLGKNYLTNGND